MGRAKLLLLWLPIFLLCSDIVNIFTPPPPKPVHRHQHPRSHYVPKPDPVPRRQPLDFPAEKPGGTGGIGLGNTVNINFCSSCSYRGNAITMKNMLETAFPGVEVVLGNYPPALPKRLLSKVVPVVQFGIVGIIMAGDQIFPILGFMAPPSWYYSLQANRFGSIASTWLMGNFIQSFLQSSGAFEVYCNRELVFSKLKEQRFPGEIELRELVGRKITNLGVVDAIGGGLWS